MKRDAIGTPIAKQTLIGQRVRKPDAPEKATGKTRYINDMVLPQMLIGKVLFAGRPHARIVRIDTSAAEKLPGVHAVLTGKDAVGFKFGFTRDNVALKDKATFKSYVTWYLSRSGYADRYKKRVGVVGIRPPI